MIASSFPYKRILLKLSGEALMGQASFGLDPQVLARTVQDIIAVHQLGIQICIVIGGGNIFRGIKGASQGLDRTTSDYMGMLATIMNGLALQSAFEKNGIDARLQSALPLESICETYTRRRAIAHLEKNRVMIFAAGTGNPYFTTDTAAVLRANEMNCNALFKGTRVDGIYSSDPHVDSEAVRFTALTYDEVLQENLRVMDMAAIALARDNHLPVIVFSIQHPDNFLKVIKGQGLSTVVTTLTQH